MKGGPAHSYFLDEKQGRNARIGYNSTETPQRAADATAGLMFPLL